MQNTLIGIVVAVVVIGGGFLLWQSTEAPATDTPSGAVQMTTNTNPGSDYTPSQTGDTGSTNTNGGAGVNVGVTVNTPKTVTVSYSGSVFSPSTVTINKGDTVKFVSTGSNMWVASASHPEHTVYAGTTRTAHCPDTSGTAFDQCAPGASYSFTFQKTGTWGYHDHLNASAFGKVVVQ